MADDTTNPGPEDGRFISDQEHELDYWTKTLGVTRAELRDAISVVGRSARRVREYLSGKEDDDFQPV